MKKLKFISIILLVVFTITCKNKASRSDSNYNESESFYNEETEEAYPDDAYCADVEYYNPDTGTRSSYTLNVEVENNEVTVIHFSSGWLDSSEFSSEALDSDGYCSITSYDGRQFNIQITGSECSFTDEAQVQNDLNDVSCPECGGTKSEYDNICDDCKRKAEDKEEHTCKRCGQEDSFMWSGDELCSDCKRADEEKQREEEEREEEEQNNQE